MAETAIKGLARVESGEVIGYEYIVIEQAGKSASGKSTIFKVRNSRAGELLGEVRWYGRWWQYCFFPEASIVFSAGCLEDIEKFLRAETQIVRKDRPIFLPILPPRFSRSARDALTR
jgi:hypothetical protein